MTQPGLLTPPAGGLVAGASAAAQGCGGHVLVACECAGRDSCRNGFSGHLVVVSGRCPKGPDSVSQGLGEVPVLLHIPMFSSCIPKERCLRAPHLVCSLAGKDPGLQEEAHKQVDARDPQDHGWGFCLAPGWLPGSAEGRSGAGKFPTRLLPPRPTPSFSLSPLASRSASPVQLRPLPRACPRTPPRLGPRGREPTHGRSRPSMLSNIKSVQNIK